MDTSGLSFQIEMAFVAYAMHQLFWKWYESRLRNEHGMVHDKNILKIWKA